jgi:hypothetical protein
MRVAQLMDPMVIAFGLGVGAAVAVAPAVIIAVPLALGAVAWLIQRARPRTPELEVAPA